MTPFCGHLRKPTCLYNLLEKTDPRPRSTGTELPRAGDEPRWSQCATRWFLGTSLAAGFYEPKYLNLILEHHGDPNSINPATKLTPLFDLVTVTFVEETDDQVENFKALIKAGADIEYRLPRQDNLLFYTITQHYPRYILALLESGADFRALNNRGEDCVMLLYPELETDPRYGDIKKWMERVGFDLEAARKAAPTWTKPMTLPVEERPGSRNARSR